MGVGLTANPDIIKQGHPIISTWMLPVHRTGHICLLYHSLMEKLD